MNLGPARSLVVLSLLALLGCKAETFGGEDPVIDPAALTMVAGPRLAGSAVTLAAPWMAQVGDSISLAVDDGAALLTGRDPAHPGGFRLALAPALPAGTHQIYLFSHGGEHTPIGVISTGGFSETRYAAGSVLSPNQPDPSLPGVFSEGAGADLQSCKAVEVDARQAEVTALMDAQDCGYGIGTSYVPGRFMLNVNALAGQWARVGRALGRVVSDSLAFYGTNWPAHELAPGLYLADYKERTVLVDDSAASRVFLDGGAGSYYIRPQHIAFSEDGAWAISDHHNSTAGLLIIDRQARSYHWSPGWVSYTRALFQPSGGLVAFGTRERFPGGPLQEIVAHIDVVTGAILDSSYFAPAGSPYDLPVALSTTGWIVIPAYIGDHFELSIRDAVTLAEIAHPVSRTVVNSCYDWTGWSVVEDQSLGRFYLVGTDCYQAITIATFQLPE